MAIELTMPALSPTMEKGTLARWLVAEGDQVKAGDLLAEIETDKATMELEASDDGRIARLIVPDGTQDVAVGTIIALLADPGGEAIEAAMVSPVEEAAPAIAGPVEPAPIVADVTPRPEPEMSTMPRSRATAADGVKVSPLALRIAEAKGIDLAGVAGSGPNGRIVRADLGLASRPPEPVSYSETGAQPLPDTKIAPPTVGVPVETVALTSMRRTIARRLSMAKQTVPHFYLTARCRLDAVLALRSELNAGLSARGVKLSVNDMLLKAMALALTEVPDANVQFGDDVLHRFSRVDIAMAVAIEGGLVTPVIRDVGALSLSAIATSAQALAAKAREGRLMPEDYDGGTASISNLGMFGIDEMVPVINPPQALILGIAAGIEQPWKVDDALGLATIMAATGSFDHRAIDGVIAARFMQAFRHAVETPLLLCS